MQSWPILDGVLHLATTTVGADGAGIAGGACDPDRRRAEARARAEAVERHTLLTGCEHLATPRAAVTARGTPLLAPGPAHVDDPWWVVGRHGHDDREVAVLARAALLGWTDGRPLPWKQSSTGSALREDVAVGFAEALAECVERYAVRQVWRGDARLHVVEDPEAYLPAGLAGAFARTGLRVHAWTVRTGLPVTVVLAALTRVDREQITFGAAARPAAGRSDAVRHAVLEAVSVRAALAGSGLARDATDVDAARRIATTQQADFLDHLNTLTDPPGDEFGGLSQDPSSQSNDLADAITDRFGVPVVRIEVPVPDEPTTLVRVHVPHLEFLTPLPGRGGYELAPGYLE